MIGKIIVFILCVIAAVLTFRGEWILKTLFRAEEVSEKQIMTLKYVALGLAVLAFAFVFLTQ